LAISAIAAISEPHTPRYPVRLCAIINQMFQFNWKPSREFVSEVRTHHTMIGGYELVRGNLASPAGRAKVVERRPLEFLGAVEKHLSQIAEVRRPYVAKLWEQVYGYKIGRT